MFCVGVEGCRLEQTYTKSEVERLTEVSWIVSWIEGEVSKGALSSAFECNVNESKLRTFQRSISREY
jgi:hypothetical protein